MNNADGCRERQFSPVVYIACEPNTDLVRLGVDLAIMVTHLQMSQFRAPDSGLVFLTVARASLRRRG